MNQYVTAHEYEKNVNPKMIEIPIKTKNINDCKIGITNINFSDLYNVDYDCTTPNLLASFIRINDKIEINKNSASSNLFFIINGSCEFKIDETIYISNAGEILVTPCFNLLEIRNVGTEELQIYYVNDSPIVNYLGCFPIKKIFNTSKYTKEFLLSNLNNLSNPNNNRKGILLSNKDTEKIGTNTITPVLWALYNELPPNTVQKPHKHNSVALDLCISCSDSDNIYTLVGNELDDNGNIVNPIKINWKQSEMFITPPGLWHSHNNTGNTFAYILPIQDAGILLYQRILGIVLN
jgi:gentisate 1,2-dioxygenase